MYESSESSAKPTDSEPELSVPDWRDPVIELYKKDVDRTLLRENLKLTVDERFEKFRQFSEFATQLRDAGRQAREKR